MCGKNKKKQFKCTTSSTKVLELYEIVDDKRLQELLPTIKNALIEIGISKAEADNIVSAIQCSSKYFKESDRKGIDGKLKCGYIRVMSQKTEGKTVIALCAVVAEAHLGLFRSESTQVREEIAQYLYQAVEYWGSASVHNLVLTYFGDTHPAAKMIVL